MSRGITIGLGTNVRLLADSGAMSALGQERTSPVTEPMSALPPKADIERHEWHVRFVKSGHNAVQQNLFLLDHLVGERQQLVRNLEFERLGGSQIDRQLEFGGLHDRQLGRLGAIEDAPGVQTQLVTVLGPAGAVAHQSAGGDELTPLVGGRDAVAGGQGQDRRAQTWNKVLAPKTTALALRSTMAAKAALT